MFCKKCGTEYADTESFCPRCGTPSGGAEKGPKESNPLFMAATIVQSVAALFVLIFCFQWIIKVNDKLKGAIPPLASLVLLAAVAAVIFVLVCLWLIFAGKQSGNTTLAGQGQKLLPISLLVQLIVEAVFYGGLFLILMVWVINPRKESALEKVGVDGSPVLLLLGVLILAASVILLHICAMKAAKTGVADSNTSVLSFVAGGIHVATLLVLFVASGADAVNFLMLGCLAGADIVFGIMMQKMLAK